MNSGDPGVANEIRQHAQQSIPSNLHVGFVIVYGGADTNDEASTGDKVSQTVTAILKQYSHDGFAPLRDAVFYNPDPGQHTVGSSYGLGDIEVAVFAYNR